MNVHVSIEDATGVDSVDIEDVPDMDDALEEALDLLGRPLTGRDEGAVTIRIRSQ